MSSEQTIKVTLRWDKRISVNEATIELSRCRMLVQQYTWSSLVRWKPLNVKAVLKLGQLLHACRHVHVLIIHFLNFTFKSQNEHVYFSNNNSFFTLVPFLMFTKKALNANYKYRREISLWQRQGPDEIMIVNEVQSPE